MAPSKGHGQWPPASPYVQVWTDNEGRPVTGSLFYSDTVPHTLDRLDWTRDPDNPWVWMLIDNHSSGRFAYSIAGTAGSITTEQLNAGGFVVFDDIGQITPGVYPE